MTAGGGSLVVIMAAMLTATLICVASGKTMVQVTNLIEYDKSMVIHCRSLDDDLGRRTLLYGQSMEWRFKPNFSKTTLFYCNSWWETGVMLQIHFDAYDYMRDHYRCGSNCRWLFTVNGIYITRSMTRGSLNFLGIHSYFTSFCQPT
ncbi:S-protein homolog 29-like [Cynara cardunculus var. scolymus]|uniref:S-protein homolog 29-like n=1 Tax=Cynara cardunculus var. scolymus TaxID=59895 RepID=UPI000D62BCC5|nr:S-protein homolog 29-like [Cynara cardunculus var. scolymus]